MYNRGRVMFALVVVLATLVCLSSAAFAAPACSEGFEGTPSDYNIYADPNCEASISTDAALSGSNGLKLVLDDGDNYARVKLDISALGLKLKDIYRASCWVKRVTGNANLPYLMFDVATPAGPGLVIQFSDVVVSSNQWTQKVMDGSTLVHVPDGRWNLPNGTFSSSNGGGTFASLCQQYGWGDLPVTHVRVGAGMWPSEGVVSPYAAYVDNIRLVPQVASYGISPTMLGHSDIDLYGNPFSIDPDSAAPTAAFGAPEGFGESCFNAAVTEGAALESDRYRTLRIAPATLFGKQVKISDIASISYVTNKSLAQSSDDWGLSVYTVPTGSDNAKWWYKSRIQAHPDECDGLTAPANVWNTWTTDSGVNNSFKLYDQDRGSYNMKWNSILAGSTSRNYSNEYILHINMQLGWNTPPSPTVQSSLDAVKIELTDGSKAVIDLGCGAILSLNVPEDSKFVQPGEIATVVMRQSQMMMPAAGYQAFISFNNGMLTCNAGSSLNPMEPGVPAGGLNQSQYTSFPYGWPIMAINPDNSGNLILAAGINAATQSPSAVDADLAFLKFVAGSVDGPTQITFGSDASTSKFTDNLGYEIDTLTKDSQTIIVDGTPPVLTVPAGVTVEYPGSTEPVATGTATATDANEPIAITYSDVEVAQCGPTKVITRTWKAVDQADNVATADQIITVVDTTKPELSAPADATVEYPGSTDPSATGTATATDNSGSATVTHTDSEAPQCGPTKIITRTWKAEDECGNVATKDQIITVVDTTKPELSVPADATVEYPGSTDPSATGTATATDNSGSATVTHADSEAAQCGPTKIITRTWKAEDACGNVATKDQIITVVDTTKPVLSVPAAITVYSLPGSASATVDPGMATATDNSGNAVVVGKRPGGLPLVGSYPAGNTTITWTATDACGNATEGYQTITVLSYNVAEITVALNGAFANTSFTRCIEFTFGGEGTTPGSHYVVSKQVTFTNGQGSAVIDSIPAGFGWSCVSAKDKVHSLRMTTGLSAQGDKYVASFTGADALLCGDLTNDNVVDILDFGVFAGQFGRPIAKDTPCGYSARHADISGNGSVGIEDYTFISINFLRFSEQLCGYSTSVQTMPRMSVTLNDLAAVAGYPAAVKADVDGNRIINGNDVKLFVDKYMKRSR